MTPELIIDANSSTIAWKYFSSLSSYTMEIMSSFLFPQPQLGVGLVNERDVMLDHHQRLTDGDLVHSLQMEIQRMQRREQSVLTAMELMRQELTEKDQLLQLLTNQLKSTNLVETEQKQCQHSEYEEKLRMCHDTIHRLEEKLQSADRAVELLERKLKERKESMEQMATREHNYQLALESLQKQFAEKEDQLQSVKNELNHLVSQRIGSQKLISENKDLQKRLKAKHGQLKQLCQQFLQYQKERISVISQALATHYEHKRHDQKADT